MEIHEDGSDSHLLPGYRFCPMEEELILSYLCPKVKGEEVPGEDYLIFNSDLYGKNDPWEIWNMYKERRKNDLRFSQDLYFFTQRKKRTVNGSRKGRTIGSGTWKAVSSDDVSAGGTVVGHRSRFSYENKESVEHGRWIMLEYELERSQVSMLDQQEVHKYVLCKLRKNKGSKEKGKRVDEDDQEKLATGDDIPDNFPALEEYKNVKQEEPEIKQGEEDQGMHADGDDVCDAGPSLSSELQEAENCWKQYLNPIIFVDDDNLVPPYADALQWEEENFLGTQSFVTCFDDNVQPFPVADHELQRKAENCGQKCLEHRQLVRPFTADCKILVDMLGEESYLSKKCPMQCTYCDYVQPFGERSNIYMSREEHPVPNPRVIGQEHQGSRSKATHNSSKVRTSTNRQPDMIATKSTSTDHHRADDHKGRNDVDEGLGAGTKSLKYGTWISSFSKELLREAPSNIKV